jgi:hypothetical protein
MRRIFIPSVCFLFLFPSLLFSEDEHSHAERELGVSLAYVDLMDEDEAAPSIHLHLVKRLHGSDLLERLGIGLGFETIFADHAHHTLMASLIFFPIDHLAISVSPGIVWVNEEGGWENHYATHIEASYGFKIGKYEVGPVIGWAESDEGSHRMFGIHFGFEF